MQKNKKQTQTAEKFIQDISPIEGVYEDFVYLKDNSLISMIKVEGINLDLLAQYEQNVLFEDYASFLGQNKEDNPEIVSMTIPLDMKNYNLYWKKRYLEAKANNANKHLLQLIASYCLEYQDMELSSDLTTKQHLIILSEKLKKRTIEELKLAEKTLNQKVKNVRNSLNTLLESYDAETTILNAKDIIIALHRFIDFKNSIYV
ncbi:TrsD/TraD family conjugative transfer protein (plasmid) [Clostridium tyrobutyricum]|uniref:TrsD/TraD family conjugative transfer protein n=1 Tax=Clostridium tyrobutyricum TaxID=1519 RepID=UPI0039F6B37A